MEKFITSRWMQHLGEIFGVASLIKHQCVVVQFQSLTWKLPYASGMAKGKKKNKNKKPQNPKKQKTEKKKTQLSQQHLDCVWANNICILTNPIWLLKVTIAAVLHTLFKKECLYPNTQILVSQSSFWKTKTKTDNKHFMLYSYKWLLGSWKY